MKSSNIGGQAVLEGIMMKHMMIMPWQSVSLTEKSL